MSGPRLCLLLAIGAVLAVSVLGSSAANNRKEFDRSAEAFRVWDAFKPHSRVKRESILGPVGYIIGSILLIKARVLTYLFYGVDIPLRALANFVATLANYFNPNPYDRSFNNKWTLLG